MLLPGAEGRERVLSLCTKTREFEVEVFETGE